MKLPNWVLTNRFVKAELRNDGNYNKLDKRQECSQDDANMVSSLAWEDPVTGKRLHYPCLDIDFEAELIPSSTPGHYHLYLKKLLDEEAYTEVITVLAKHGILQGGIERQIKDRKETTLRLPHVKKQVEFYAASTVPGVKVGTGTLLPWTTTLATNEAISLTTYNTPVADKFAEISEKLTALEEKFEGLQAACLPEAQSFTVWADGGILDLGTKLEIIPEGEFDEQQ